MVAATFQPFSAKYKAVAFPIPLDVPVMKIVCLIVNSFLQNPAIHVFLVFVDIVLYRPTKVYTACRLYNALYLSFIIRVS